MKPRHKIAIPCATREQIKNSKSKDQYENLSLGTVFPRCDELSSEYRISSSTFSKEDVTKDGAEGGLRCAENLEPVGFGTSEGEDELEGDEDISTTW